MKHWQTVVGYILIVSHSLSFFLPQMEKLIQLSFVGGENLPNRGWARNGFCYSSCLISILNASW